MGSAVTKTKNESKAMSAPPDITKSLETNPYKNKSDYNFWHRSISRIPWPLVDPMINQPFLLKKDTKIASAGSCFAQHIARYLQRNAYTYFVTEPDSNVKEQTFSAHYGNIYTTRQLWQLYLRAYGQFVPDKETSIWQRTGDGLFVDAFRPTVCRGQATPDEVLQCRNKHLAKVRLLFEKMEVFIFTLGLTESWRGLKDNAAYPVAPGVMNTNFNPGQFGFHNLSFEEVRQDLVSFIANIRKINPGVKFIFTVSPVPLAATYEDQHILVANCYSKSTLRVAAHEVCQEYKECFYFPSYEIFTGQFTRGRFYENDCREVARHGVDFAMSIFLRHFTDLDFSAASGAVSTATSADEVIICDEDSIA